ncbi:MAG TPA: polyhydroxybutyrate depolymerase [Xanthobacteraceae bacterium]|nr:polyhydroxybutyrate depolymerase [Xanthobacteraceae bacterium]
MPLALRNVPLHCLVLVLAFVGLVSTPASAADLEKLPSYNADIAESSVSGLSSGAFMAVQFATAWSSTIRGVGVISGGPVYCAQARSQVAITQCMQGPPPPLNVFTGMTDKMAASGAIDPTDNLRRQKIYLFHGYNDGTVVASVMQATNAFYEHYLGDAGRGNLFFQDSLGAGHAFVLARPAQAAQDCSASKSPFIDSCGYDQAGIILQHIYGALEPPRSGNELTGKVKSFSQETYAEPDTPGALSMAEEGYVFVPKDCEIANGPACRVHIVLHGCLQDANDVGRQLVDRVGYNEWADTNRIIVIYPQTRARPLPLPGQPLNPMACWDWWGYVNNDDDYITKSGRQITAIKRMLDALTAKYRKQPATPPAAATAPAGVAVIDTTDRAAALAWRAVPGADAYRVWRAGPGAGFEPVGSVAGPSFADAGLAPQSAYRWHVTAVVAGVEGPASTDVSATTKPTPPACEQPGSCPLGPGGK